MAPGRVEFIFFQHRHLPKEIFKRQIFNSCWNYKVQFRQRAIHASNLTDPNYETYARDISIFFERPKKCFEQMMAAIQTAKDMRPRWRSACAVVNMVLAKRLAEEMILTRTDEQKKTNHC